MINTVLFCTLLLAVLAEDGFLDLLFGKPCEKIPTLRRGACAVAAFWISALIGCPIVWLVSLCGLTLPRFSILLPLAVLVCLAASRLCRIFAKGGAIGERILRTAADAAILCAVFSYAAGGDGFFQSARAAVTVGICYLGMTVLYAAVRERLAACRLPWFLRGLPITLIVIALLAAILFGFSDVLLRPML